MFWAQKTTRPREQLRLRSASSRASASSWSKTEAGEGRRRNSLHANRSVSLSPPRKHKLCVSDRKQSSQGQLTGNLCHCSAVDRFP